MSTRDKAGASPSNRQELTKLQRTLINAYSAVSAAYLDDRQRARMKRDPNDYFGKAKHPANVAVRTLLGFFGPPLALPPEADVAPPVEDNRPPTAEEAQAGVEAALGSLRSAIKEYRKVSGQAPHFMLDKPAPLIPAEALHGCDVFNHRYALLDALPDGGTVGEVGTMHGDFAREILDRKQPDELHLFDVSFARLRDDVAGHQAIKTHKGRSAARMKQMPDDFFDWIYLDADHTYAGVKDDVDASLPKLKKNGILVFNDYILWSPLLALPYGVITAANELLADGWTAIGIALTPHGYFDVAMRRE